ncbi:MAG TPA: 5-formyltetrahydrofolate cyclo-ligase [Albitalea sp.]|uniref:5-formyltetrahydrofolate cyclo-ligase n=1 Tax=Piscinibacter sp. TaxID=1903157 RepID=UPI002ED2A3C5
MRERLHRIRDAFAADSGVAAQDALAAHVSGVLEALQPECLGLYWPLRSEFNAASACLADRECESIGLALPYARKSLCEMHYRAWDRSPPTLRDECGIPACAGLRVVPDVVLVPCLGYTRSGYRLGYGGGYYDRWLAAHPHVTAVGIAWAATEITDEQLMPEAHDHPMIMVITEHGAITP